MTTLSAPSRVVWEYFLSLRQLVAGSAEAPSPELSRQAAALAVIMGVTVAEVFLNLWFRVRVEEKHTAPERAAFLKDLSPPFASLDKKLKNWPLRYLGTALDLSSGPGGQFMLLKERRNSIVHFTTTHESFTHGGVSIHGLADTPEYDSLAYPAAAWALKTAEDLVAEIFRLAGVTAETIPHALHAWCGKAPA